MDEYGIWNKKMSEDVSKFTFPVNQQSLSGRCYCNNACHHIKKYKIILEAQPTLQFHTYRSSIDMWIATTF